MKNELNISFPAKLCNVQTSRAILIGFLAELDLSMSVINELKTALSEAVTNAIVHGYENDEKKPNPQTLSGRLSDHSGSHHTQWRSVV